MKNMMLYWVAVLLLFTPLVASADRFDDLYYTSDGTNITITDYAYSYFIDDALDIPFTIESLPVTTIGRGAFSGCDGLNSVTIPGSVTTIGDSAFSRCDDLTRVTIGSNVTTIGKYAFFRCDALTAITVAPANSSYSSADGVLYDKNQTRLIQYPGGLTSVTIPDSVTHIGDDAFGYCDGLTSATIPSSVTTIGDSAFRGCEGLTSVTIGSSVTNLGNYAFHGCASLASVTIPDSVTRIGYSVFRECEGLINVTIGNGVTNIGKYAFYRCGGLTSVTIGSSVTTIGYNAFYRCGGLISVAIPDNVTTIGRGAFGECGGLTSVTIPDSATSIGNRAFYVCRGLTSVTIPDSVTTIGDEAFRACDGLTSVRFKGNAPSIDSSTFARCDSATVYRMSGAIGWPAVPGLWGGRPTALWPPLTWSTTAGVTWHRIWVYRNGSTYIKKWLQQAEGTWTIDQDLIAGDYTWWSRPWNEDSGYLAAWSAGGTFTVPVLSPGESLPLTPSGQIMTNNPTFVWAAVTNGYAAWYQIWVSKGGRKHFASWVEVETNYVHSANLPMGNYTWFVRGWSHHGYGHWSAGKTFNFGTSTLLAPTGTIVERQPTFVWTQCPLATHYKLRVEKNGRFLHSLWLAGTESTNWNCTLELPGADYAWWVQAWSPDGFGPWSSRADFTIPVAAPSAINLVSPAGAQAAGSLDYIWQADANASSYQLYVNLDGTAWYNQAQDTGFVSGNVTSSVPNHISGDYTWWVRGQGPDGSGDWSTTGTFTVP